MIINRSRIKQMFKWLYHNWLRILFLILFIIFIYYLKNLNTDQVWQIASLGVAGTAALFAGYSVIMASKSLEITKDSLELTKNVTRPFLNTTNEPEYPEVIGQFPNNSRVTLYVRNTGTLPADNVSISCTIYTVGDTEGIFLEHSSTQSPSIYFPGDEIDHRFHIREDVAKLCQNGEFVIRVTIKYKNKLINQECTTKRYFTYESLSTSPRRPQISTDIKDWWD